MLFEIIAYLHTRDHQYQAAGAPTFFLSIESGQDHTPDVMVELKQIVMSAYSKGSMTEEQVTQFFKKFPQLKGA
jgi:hypothetical protein